ncbi:MAG TPA: hypothetical protein VF277_06425, partial [Steroidobacteraceae bacterium]
TQALAQFREHLRALGPDGPAAPSGATRTGAAWRARLAELPMPLRLAGQVLMLGAVAVLIGWFATRPSYAYLGHEQALIKLSFSHAAQSLKPCRHYTQEELAKLPITQRRATTCERGRWPVYLELDLDGQPVHRGTHPPAGLWDDGPSTVYASFRVPAGKHRIDARLRDSGRKEGFDYAASDSVTLVPGQNFVIDFRGTEGSFRFGRQVLPNSAAPGGAP